MLRAAANYPVQGSGFYYYSKSGYIHRNFSSVRRMVITISMLYPLYKYRKNDLMWKDEIYLTNMKRKTLCTKRDRSDAFIVVDAYHRSD